MEHALALLRYYHMSIKNLGQTDPFFGDKDGPFLMIGKIGNTSLEMVMDSDDYGEAIAQFANELRRLDQKSL